MSKRIKNGYRHQRALIDQIYNLDIKKKAIDERIADLKEQLAAIKNPAPALSFPKDDRIYCGKILYVSQHAAAVAMRIINADLKQKGEDLLKRAYFCEECDAWHLTTVPAWQPG
jgi:hypothetical protein